jgi:hypothetical protein
MLAANQKAFGCFGFIFIAVPSVEPSIDISDVDHVNWSHN